MDAQVSLGPLLFHWPVDKWLDFYGRIADEAPVDMVYLGEVVCAKRAPFYTKHYEDVAARLTRGGKKVIFSTLAEVTVKHDRATVADLCDLEDVLVEANDMSALRALRNRPHTVGSYLNVYNESAMKLLASRGAKHFCLPTELPAEAIATLATFAKKIGVTLETQVYGRLPLALSARCYHARALGRIKDNCQYACEQDANGMELKTLTGQKFLVINGIQTLSQGCLNLAHEIPELRKMGISTFRLSPQDTDMVKVAEIFSSLLRKRSNADEATRKLESLWPEACFINGFYHHKAGHEWLAETR
jgi:collagenase-like PrtC family protease